ncbi:restriction endonuclease [Streptomyces vinaceusdrappus]|nr:restriction endonuclease [Streptomyces vinaceusdrappus]
MSSRRALQVCPTPGCPTLTPQGRCEDCQRKAGRQRPSAASKGYDARWVRTRAAYLRAHPLCECEECEAMPALLRPRATEVNHRDGLGPLGPRGHDWANLQAMTKAHHSRETARHQPGGWNDRTE